MRDLKARHKVDRASREFITLERATAIFAQYRERHPTSRFPDDIAEDFMVIL